MALHLKDGKTARRVERLARTCGVSKKEAVRGAVQPELDRTVPPTTLRDRVIQSWADHPVSTPTGLRADKAFFDALSGEEDFSQTVVLGARAERS